MNSRWVSALAVVAGCLSVAVVPVQAAGKYAYGGYRPYGNGAAASGFYVHVEAGLYNPRNTDAVAATVVSGGVTTQALPVWDDEMGGRLAVGYRFDSGSRLEIAVWGYESDTGIADSGTGSDVVFFGIGPAATSAGGPISSGSPGFFAVNTEFEAMIADVTYGKSAEVAERLTLEWSLGARYAHYEENHLGLYGDTTGSNLFDAAKSLEGEGFGVRAALEGRFALTPAWALKTGLGFSFLDGELTGSSSLLPRGQPGVAGAVATVFDDSRSGEIRDFDVAIEWTAWRDALRLSLGWEQSRWDGLPEDLLRNLTGSAAVLRERDSVTFSGYRLGVAFRF